LTTFRLTVAYDGTDLVGWQRQASGTSVQGLLEEALSALEAGPVTVTGAGRTDAGVHAEGQVAAARLGRPIAAATLVRAMNARLPPAVRVLAAEPAPDAFHPRFDAAAKTYRYRLFTDPVMSPFAVRYAWHVPGPLDVTSMGEAAAALTGEHDFSAFRSTGTETDSTIRVLYESSVVAGGSWLDASIHTGEPSSRGSAFGPWVSYVARGNGFLRHMVRAIVGSLVEVGLGRRPVGWLAEVLAAGDRSAAGPTAPPQGLCLVRVEYPTLAARL
jgi:tRNA pseudouridine38-40 synthase